jgi:hypothetical protein
MQHLSMRIIIHRFDVFCNLLLCITATSRIQRMREEHAKKELEKEIQVPALVHVLVCACLHSHLGLRMHELA